jgi:hydrogenase-4 component E
MGAWSDAILVLLMGTNLLLLGSSRLAGCIRIVAGQGVLLGLLPLVQHEVVALRAVLLAVGTMTLKGVVFPRLLTRALREAEVRREVEPYVGYTASLVVGAAAFAVSVWIGSRLRLPSGEDALLPVAVSFFTILTGLFLLVSRRKALNQVLGYLTMENGIYAFGLALAHREPMLVELGVLLDVFVAVFVMGIIVFHIHREFDTINTDRLSVLRD